MDGHLEACDHRTLFKQGCVSKSKQEDKLETCEATCSYCSFHFKLTACTLLNLTVLLNCAECVLGPPSSKCCCTLSPNNRVDKGKIWLVLFHLFFLCFINDVKSFVLLTDHSQPSHAVNLLCIRWRPCECTSPLRSYSMFCILMCLLNVSSSIFSRIQQITLPM